MPQDLHTTGNSKKLRQLRQKDSFIGQMMKDIPTQTSKEDNEIGHKLDNRTKTNYHN